jgi:hypothetical protein
VCSADVGAPRRPTDPPEGRTKGIACFCGHGSRPCENKSEGWLYIRMSVHGHRIGQAVDYIFIQRAQDFSLFYHLREDNQSREREEPLVNWNPLECR